MVTLGGSLRVEPLGIGMGCMSVSGQYSDGVPMEEPEYMTLFKGVYDAGCRHFDTAEVYKSGPLFGEATPDTVYNESQLGKFFQTVPRESFTVATKYMPTIRENRNDYDAVKGALEKSLRRLQLDYVDVYYSHMVLSLEGVREFVESCKELKEEGLIKNIGLSEIAADWLREAHKVHPICCVQQEWNLLTRAIEEFLVPTCKELGIGIVAYSPLARKLLTAPKERPTDIRHAIVPRFQEENFKKNQEMLVEVEKVAAKKEVSPAQLSMAWLLQKAKDLQVDVLPIPGTAKLEHALENLGGVKVTMEPSEMELLEKIAELTAGERESQVYMSMRLEGQSLRERFKEDHVFAAEQMVKNVSQAKFAWAKPFQEWLLESLKKEGGAEEAMLVAIRTQAEEKDDGMPRLFPGASNAYQLKVLEELKQQGWEKAARASFAEELASEA